MIILVVVLALLVTTLAGAVLGAWLALRFVQAIRPGREGDLLAELATLRASEGLHLAALKTNSHLWRAASAQTDAGS